MSKNIPGLYVQTTPQEYELNVTNTFSLPLFGKENMHGVVECRHHVVLYFRMLCGAVRATVDGVIFSLCEPASRKAMRDTSTRKCHVKLMIFGEFRFLE